VTLTEWTQITPGPSVLGPEIRNYGRLVPNLAFLLQVVVAARQTFA
jgi:hypothetical protein